jgi:hypothetical protein
VKCPKDDTGHTTVFNSGLETEWRHLFQLDKTLMNYLATHQYT